MSTTTFTNVSSIELHGSLTTPVGSTFTLPASTVLVGGQFAGGGSVVVPAGGTFRETSCDGSVAGPLVNNGTLTLECGQLIVTRAVTNNGTITGSGRIVSYEATKPTLTNATSGVIRPETNGNLGIDIPVVNNGRIVPTLGSLAFSSLTLRSTSVLQADVGPTGAVARVSVSGNTSLGGTLAITTTSSYTPAVGTSVTVLSTGGTQAGSFSFVTNRAIRSTAVAWTVLTSNGLVRLSAQANQPPSANAGANFEVNSGIAFVVRGSGVDPEGAPLQFRWTLVSGAPAVLRREREAEVTVDPITGPATVTLRLTVTDSAGLMATDDVTVTIKKPK